MLQMKMSNTLSNVLRTLSSDVNDRVMRNRKRAETEMSKPFSR